MVAEPRTRVVAVVAGGEKSKSGTAGRAVRSVGIRSGFLEEEFLGLVLLLFHIFKELFLQSLRWFLPNLDRFNFSKAHWFH